ALVQAADGYFYGTTQYAVYRIASDGTFYVVHYLSETEGSGPSALIQGSDGNFYFTMQSYGADGNGAVLQMTPGGTVTVLHAFAGASDGAAPTAALVQARD